MLINKIKLIFLILLLYQSPTYSKSSSFDQFNSKNLSNYFSGIIAFDNKDNSNALDFFNSSKILMNKHNPYLRRYIFSLVLENKISQAINVVKNNFGEENTNFFDAYLLLIFDSIKKKNLNQANLYLEIASNINQNDRLNEAIIETLRQYLFTFKEKKIQENKKNFGNISLISETFQRCYLNDKKTGNFFLNLINNQKSDYSRYLYFYLGFLIDNGQLEEVKTIIEDIDYINSTLLLSQGKYWIKNENYKKFNELFSCRNHNDVISEFLFLISNIYSSQDNYEKSNFYLNLSNYLNPKFKFNLSLVAENYYYNEEYKKTKKILKNFTKEEIFYYWFKIKKEAQIISNQKSKEQALNFIESEFNKIVIPNRKFLFDIANFYRNAKEYKKAIKIYSKILKNPGNSSDIQSDILYRRGSSYERLGDYENADQDLLSSLEIDSEDAYVLNYLAYSWLERDIKINEAITMLETAYKYKNNDPYIIDSIGWAYYLIEDYQRAEEFLKRAVVLMPDDPIVNDHYGDILWKLDRKMQARYFWLNVLKMQDAEDDMIEKVNNKLVNGLENS